ncbi:MAG: transglycosylase SLT domain-containing protein [Hyphomonadaceae bacterium]
MHRRALILGGAVALAGCVTNDLPDDPGDACEMFETQDGWWRSVKRAEDRWGAPPELQLAIIRQESGFRHNARPPRGRILFVFPGPRASSARGYAQALNTTWQEYERARGDDGADRNEFSDAADFVSWYANLTHRELGVPYANARGHYLAYHEGRGGYRRGTYEGNSTLLASADRVQRYRDTYAGQLSRCRDDLERWWWPF